MKVNLEIKVEEAVLDYIGQFAKNRKTDLATAVGFLLTKGIGSVDDDHPDPMAFFSDDQIEADKDKSIFGPEYLKPVE